MTLVDGGDDFSAIEVLRGQTGLIGLVASDSTAWRRVADLAGDELVWRGWTPPAGLHARRRGTPERPPRR